MFLFNSWSKAKRQVKSLTSFNHVDFLKTGQESLWIKWWISLDGGLFVLEKVQLYIYIYINLVIETIVKTETSAYKIIQIECSMRRQSGITQDENTSYFIEVLQICFVWQVFNLPHSSGEIWWKITFANSLFVIHVKNTQQICNPLSSWIESLVYVKLNASILITTHVYFRMP